MAFPVLYLLIPLLLVIIVTGLFLLFNLFDMGKYGIESGATRIIIFLYVGGYLSILLISGLGLATVDWNARIDLASLAPKFGDNVNSYGL